MSQPDQLPKFLQPALKMFLSVDLIGSTKLKHDENVLTKETSGKSLDDIGASWFNSLIDFYGGFEEKFTQAWSQAFSSDGIAKTHWSKDSNPSLWKVNGDELIYVLDISHPGQIVAALYAWKEALINYRQHLKEIPSRLDVKATAWMAGFPIGNHEVAFWSDLSHADAGLPEHAGKFGQYNRLSQWYEDKEADKKSDYVKDYIGPAVDTGFRISSFASARKFPVSIEIAYFLSLFDFDDGVKEKIALRFHGRESLKGVLSGIPYPIFWIDTASPNDELTKAEDRLAPKPPPCKPLEVREYVTLFFDDEKNKLFRPFIHECDDEIFCTMPDRYLKLLEHTASVWNSELEKIRILDSADEPDDGVEPDTARQKDIEEIIKLLFSKDQNTKGSDGDVN